MESSNFIYTRNTLYVSSASTRSFRKLGRAKNVVLFSNINQAPVKHQCSDFCLQQQWMEYRLIREDSKVLLLLPAKACDMLDLFPSKLIIFCTKLQSWNPSSSLLTGEGMHLAKNTHTHSSSWTFQKKTREWIPPSPLTWLSMWRCCYVLQTQVIQTL